MKSTPTELSVYRHYTYFHEVSFLHVPHAFVLIRNTMKVAGAERVCLSVEAMVRYYHMCKNVLDTTLGIQFPFQSEDGNSQDAVAVAVLKDGALIGHVPLRISTACFKFLH